MYGNRNPPEKPPCDTCLVELAEENEEAGWIYQLVQGQIVTRFNGEYDVVIDLNYHAVKTVMDLYGVKDQRGVFETVRAVFFHFLRNRAE
jgi:hypothetical protein